MGHQIIQQPDGKWAIFSSIVDTWIVIDATEEEIIDYYAKKAEKRVREEYPDLFAKIKENPRQAYAQFALTFDEADDISGKHGGTIAMLRDGIKEE